MNNKIEIDWGAVTEVVALFILGLIAIVAMYKLKVDGKEIALAIGAGIGGYLTKTGVNKVKEKLESAKDDKII